MKKGKLDNEALERLVLGHTGADGKYVISGPGIGEDCAVIDFGDLECVISTDPITASASRIGSLAVHVSCNDVASNGVEPLAILLTVLLPLSVTEDEIGEIARQADETAKALGVQIIGGHTEVTDVVTQPVVSATAIGRAAKGFSAGTVENGPEPGDLIVVTKELALEGTAIAAETREEELSLSLDDEEIERAKKMLDRISVVREGVIAGKTGVAAMHDVTEGGILGAVWETCRRTNTGAEILASALPFDDVTMSVCALLDLDPTRLISSGSMLIYVKEKKWGILSAALADAGIAAHIIGSVKQREHGVTLTMKNGETEAVGPPEPDEIYKL